VGLVGGRSPPNIKFFLNLSSPQFTTNVVYKINHISKTKSSKIIKLSAKSVPEHSASCRTKKNHTILRILSEHITKTKNCKFDFPFVSEQYATIWNKKIKSALL